MKPNKRPAGAHHLTFRFDYARLDELGKDVTVAARLGCTTFVMLWIIIKKFPAKAVAEMLKRAGITTAPLCHFLPGDLSCGDWYGDSSDRDRACETYRELIGYVQALKNEGVTSYIMGPIHHVLGKQYALGDDSRRLQRVSEALQTIAHLSVEHGVLSCFEVLRPGENNGVLKGHHEAIVVYDRILSSGLMIHFDKIHSERWGENVPQMIIDIGTSRLGALELHGTDRAPAGSHHDKSDWGAIRFALDQIGCELPVVTETFGNRTQKAVPALGGDGIFCPPYGAEAVLAMTMSRFRQDGITLGCVLP